MIKKILLPILLFLTSFMIIDKVNASFQEIAPVFNSPHSSTQLNEHFNRTSPTLTYGSATYNYIVNKFITNELYLDYGEYYICIGNGTANTSSCYISNDINSFRFRVNGNEVFYLNTYSSVSPVYEYRISSGSKNSNSTWLTTDNPSLTYGYYQFSNGGYYLFTNLDYIKFDTMSTNYSTFKTADGYVFNDEDVLIYKNNGSLSLNTDYKSAEQLGPLTLTITLEDYELMGDYYSSLTYKLNFSQFDTSQYRYYYTFDGENIDQQVGRLLANPIEKNDTLLTFEMNTTFYVVVYGPDGEQVLLYSYSVNDIMNSRYDESLDVLDKHPDLPDKIDETTDITDDFTVANLIGWFRGLIDKRLPILNQITGIYKAFKFDINTDSDCIEDTYEYDPEKGYIWRSYCNKLPELNLKGIFGIDKSFEIIDVRFFLQYREQVFFWIKLSLGTYTVFKLFRIVASYFKQ